MKIKKLVVYTVWADSYDSIKRNQVKKITATIITIIIVHNYSISFFNFERTMYFHVSLSSGFVSYFAGFSPIRTTVLPITVASSPQWFTTNTTRLTRGKLPCLKTGFVNHLLLTQCDKSAIQHLGTVKTTLNIKKSMKRRNQSNQYNMNIKYKSKQEMQREKNQRYQIIKIISSQYSQVFVLYWF